MLDENDPLVKEALANRVMRNEHETAIKKLDGDLGVLVRKLFDQGESGPQIAKAIGLSTPRVHQIKNGTR